MKSESSVFGAVRGKVSDFIRGLVGRAGGVESLESRAMLSGTPLPTLSMLENANHPVVRMETAFGDVDIELFSDTNPLTVANFLNYVTKGKMDETFFHRKTTESADGISVFQGGGFIYDNGEGGSAVATDPPVILEIGAGRLNVERTIAMARTSAVNSGTNQFFFNTTDNPELDPTSSSPGYAVFGRVIQGWSNVLAMWNRPANDFDSDPAFAGSDLVGALPSVPTTADYNQTAGVRENSLIELNNIDLIKPQGFAGFFTQRSVMPEGFNSATATEWVEMFNPNSFAVQYQLVARYEAAGDAINFVAGAREKVIASGTLNANTSMRINVSAAGSATGELTLADKAYSLVLETATPEAQTSPKPIAAAIERADFGFQETSESFINPAVYTDAELKDWTFARLERNSTSREYISLYNLSAQTATVTLDVLTPDGNVRVTRVIEAYRRSGLELSGGAFAEGVLSVRVRSDQNIAAVATDWSTSTTGAGEMVRGTAGGGATSGAIAGVLNGAGRTSTISVSNQGSTATVVTFSVWRAGSSTSIDSTQVILPGTRSDFALSSLAGSLSEGERVAITYDSGTIPITAQYLSEGTGDAGATAFATRMGTATHFAQGRASSASNLALAAEVISIFNPFNAGGTALDWQVIYTFSDGTVLTGATGSLLPHARVDIATFTDPATSSLTLNATLASAEVRAKIASLFTGTGTRGNYGITVVGTVVSLPPPTSGQSLSVPASGVVQLSRYMVDATGQVIIDSGFSADGAFNLPATLPT
mgnify:CR=1 FL=1